MQLSLAITAILLSLAPQVFAATAPSKRLVGYWGQNSDSHDQQPLDYYCDSGAFDIIILSFVNNFTPKWEINFANQGGATSDSGTLVTVGAAIKACQAKGIKILLSLGGSAGKYLLSNDAEASKFATTLWETFGPVTGSSKVKRPFGDVAVDGFDFDMEVDYADKKNFRGDTLSYITLARSLRKYFDLANDKKYYLSAAPQCEFPDVTLGKVMEAVSFDFAFIQFYNNPGCDLVKGGFNFNVWQEFVDSGKSQNRNMELFIGLPGHPGSANTGYASIENVKASLTDEVRLSSHFGGISLWDAASSFANMVTKENHFAAEVKLILGGSASESISDNANKSNTNGSGSAAKDAGSKDGSEPSIGEPKIELKPPGDNNEPKDEFKPVGNSDEPKDGPKPAGDKDEPKNEIKPAGNNLGPKDEFKPAGDDLDSNDELKTNGDDSLSRNELPTALEMPQSNDNSGTLVEQPNVAATKPFTNSTKGPDPFDGPGIGLSLSAKNFREGGEQNGDKTLANKDDSSKAGASTPKAHDPVLPKDKELRELAGSNKVSAVANAQSKHGSTGDNHQSTPGSESASPSADAGQPKELENETINGESRSPSVKQSRKTDPKTGKEYLVVDVETESDLDIEFVNESDNDQKPPVLDRSHPHGAVNRNAIPEIDPKLAQSGEGKKPSPPKKNTDPQDYIYVDAYASAQVHAYQ